MAPKPRTGIVSLEMPLDGAKLLDGYARFHSSRWQSGDKFELLTGSFRLVWLFRQTWDGLSWPSGLRHTYHLRDRLGDADGRLAIDSEAKHVGGKGAERTLEPLSIYLYLLR